MKMKRDDQRYSHGSSPRAVRMPGVDSKGKPSMATTWTNLRPILGTTPPHISCPPINGVQVHRIAGQLHRMIQAGDAELQPAQEVVVRDCRAVFVDHLLAAQARAVSRPRTGAIQCWRIRA